MDYLLKTSALIMIFYVCYIIFLQRETFFNSNRRFLMLSLVTAILFPLIVIPIYVKATPVSSVAFSVITSSAPTTLATPIIPEAFDMTLVLIWIYGIGASLFLSRLTIQFFSLLVLIKNHKKKKISGYTFVETTQNIAPFSFFKWIVYNPQQFNEQELKLILKHEKIHANQFHTIDVLLMDIATALFWFNPIIWGYKKAVLQNLEFIADHHTQKQSNCDQRYQKLLLKTSAPELSLILINTFYNSTIKKRIIMLHKSKSNIMKSWKYSIIVPILVLFAMTFNTEIIAQTSSQNVSKAGAQDQQNILKFVITKDTKDEQFVFITDKLADLGATILFKNIKRNSKNEIISIKTKVKYKNNTSTKYTQLSTPIKPYEITLNPYDKTVTLGEDVSGLGQVFDIETNEDGQKEVKKTGSEKNIILTLDKLEEEKTGHEDTVLTGKNDPNLKIYSPNLNPYFIDEKSPMFILNGEEITTVQMQAIDPNTIKSLQVLKDESATNKYGEKGKNGVLIITLKNEGSLRTDDGEIISIVADQDQKTNTVSISNNGERPLYIIDGKEVTKEQMEDMDPTEFGFIQILKDKSAIKKYGKKGKNGVVIITLRKE